MTEATSDQSVFDTYVGTTRTLETICRHLIARNAIDRETLLEELLDTQAVLSQHGAPLAASIPAALFTALGGKKVTR